MHLYRLMNVLYRTEIITSYLKKIIFVFHTQLVRVIKHETVIIFLSMK